MGNGGGGGGVGDCTPGWRGGGGGGVGGALVIAPQGGSEESERVAPAC